MNARIHDETVFLLDDIKDLISDPSEIYKNWYRNPEHMESC